MTTITTKYNQKKIVVIVVIVVTLMRGNLWTFNN